MPGRILRALPWVAALLGLIAVVALLIDQLDDEGSKVDGTTLGFTGLGLALLFAVAAPMQIGAALGRISRVKVASVELGLAEVTQVERVKPLPGEDDGVGVGARPKTLNAITDYTEVVKQLTARLRFVWMILDLEPTGVDKCDYFSITTELHRRELLTDEETSFIVDMLGRDPLEAKAWPAPTRSEFLDSAWAFATRFGPLIWDRHVRRKLSESDFFIANFPQRRGHRPDFLVYREGGWAVIAARVAGAEHSPASIKASSKRLLRFADIDAISGRRIVIPDIREATGATDGVQVIKLSALLEDPNRAFD